MSGATFAFTEDQLRAAGKRFVEEGAGDNALKALRQAEVDGALNFLLSDAARKLRTTPSPSAQGIRPQTRYPVQQEQIGVPVYDPRVKPLTPAEEEDLRDG